MCKRNKPNGRRMSKTVIAIVRINQFDAKMRDKSDIDVTREMFILAVMPANEFHFRFSEAELIFTDVMELIHQFTQR